MPEQLTLTDFQSRTAEIPDYYQWEPQHRKWLAQGFAREMWGGQASENGQDPEFNAEFWKLSDAFVQDESGLPSHEVPAESLSIRDYEPAKKISGYNDWEPEMRRWMAIGFNADLRQSARADDMPGFDAEFDKQAHLFVEREQAPASSGLFGLAGEGGLISRLKKSVDQNQLGTMSALLRDFEKHEQKTIEQAEARASFGDREDAEIDFVDSRMQSADDRRRGLARKFLDASAKVRSYPQTRAQVAIEQEIREGGLLAPFKALVGKGDHAGIVDVLGGMAAFSAESAVDSAEPMLATAAVGAVTRNPLAAVAAGAAANFKVEYAHRFGGYLDEAARGPDGSLAPDAEDRIVNLLTGKDKSPFVTRDGFQPTDKDGEPYMVTDAERLRIWAATEASVVSSVEGVLSLPFTGGAGKLMNQFVKPGNESVKRALIGGAVSGIVEATGEAVGGGAGEAAAAIVAGKDLRDPQVQTEIFAEASGGITQAPFTAVQTGSGVMEAVKNKRDAQGVTDSDGGTVTLLPADPDAMEAVLANMSDAELAQIASEQRRNPHPDMEQAARRADEIHNARQRARPKLDADDAELEKEIQHMIDQGEDNDDDVIVFLNDELTRRRAAAGDRITAAAAGDRITATPGEAEVEVSEPGGEPAPRAPDEIGGGEPAPRTPDEIGGGTPDEIDRLAASGKSITLTAPKAEGPVQDHEIRGPEDVLDLRGRDLVTSLLSFDDQELTQALADGLRITDEELAAVAARNPFVEDVVEAELTRRTRAAELTAADVVEAELTRRTRAAELTAAEEAQGPTLRETVRKLGGLKAPEGERLRGELTQLRSEEGLLSLFNNETGRTLEEMAEALREEGFVEIETPSDLIDALGERDYRTRRVVSEGPAGVFGSVKPEPLAPAERRPLPESPSGAAVVQAEKPARVVGDASGARLFESVSQARAFADQNLAPGAAVFRQDESGKTFIEVQDSGQTQPPVAQPTSGRSPSSQTGPDKWVADAVADAAPQIEATDHQDALQRIGQMEGAARYEAARDYVAALVAGGTNPMTPGSQPHPAEQRVLDLAAEIPGVELVGEAGQEVKFDGRIHDSLGQSVSSARARVVTPGVRVRGPDNVFLVRKARVEPVDSAVHEAGSAGEKSSEAARAEALKKLNAMAGSPTTIATVASEAEARKREERHRHRAQERERRVARLGRDQRVRSDDVESVISAMESLSDMFGADRHEGRAVGEVVGRILSGASRVASRSEDVRIELFEDLPAREDLLLQSTALTLYDARALTAFVKQADDVLFDDIKSFEEENLAFKDLFDAETMRELEASKFPMPANLRAAIEKFYSEDLDDFLGDIVIEVRFSNDLDDFVDNVQALAGSVQALEDNWEGDFDQLFPFDDLEQWASRVSAWLSERKRKVVDGARRAAGDLVMPTIRDLKSKYSKDFIDGDFFELVWSAVLTAVESGNPDMETISEMFVSGELPPPPGAEALIADDPDFTLRDDLAQFSRDILDALNRDVASEIDKIADSQRDQAGRDFPVLEQHRQFAEDVVQAILGLKPENRSDAWRYIQYGKLKRSPQQRRLKSFKLPEWVSSVQGLADKYAQQLSYDLGTRSHPEGAELFDDHVERRLSGFQSGMLYKVVEGVPRGFYHRAGGLIGLLPDADATTVVHETAHVTRELLIGTDLGNRLANAYGVENDQWTVAQEERFADDVEQYLAEGRAPEGASARLESLLSRISEIIRGILAQLRNTVKPEVRAVLDELLLKGDESPATGHATELATPEQTMADGARRMVAGLAEGDARDLGTVLGAFLRGIDASGGTRLQQMLETMRFGRAKKSPRTESRAPERVDFGEEEISRRSPFHPRQLRKSGFQDLARRAETHIERIGQPLEEDGPKRTAADAIRAIATDLVSRANLLPGNDPERQRIYEHLLADDRVEVISADGPYNPLLHTHAEESGPVIVGAPVTVARQGLYLRLKHLPGDLRGYSNLPTGNERLALTPERDGYIVPLWKAEVRAVGSDTPAAAAPMIDLGSSQRRRQRTEQDAQIARGLQAGAGSPEVSLAEQIFSSEQAAAKLTGQRAETAGGWREFSRSRRLPKYLATPLQAVQWVKAAKNPRDRQSRYLRALSYLGELATRTGGTAEVDSALTHLGARRHQVGERMRWNPRLHVALEPDSKARGKLVAGQSRLAVYTPGWVAPSQYENAGSAKVTVVRPVLTRDLTLGRVLRQDADSREDADAETDKVSSVHNAVSRVFERLGLAVPVRVVTEVPAHADTRLASLKNKAAQLKIDRKADATAWAWLARNQNSTPWAEIKTREQLDAYVRDRFQARSQPENYQLSAEETRHAERAQLDAARQMVEVGNPDGQRALDAHRSGGWERVIEDIVNKNRAESAEVWRAYLTEGNEEYAADPYFQDLAWEIPHAAMSSGRAHGLGETVALNQGALAQVREAAERSEISPVKLYRRFLRDVSMASAKDRLATTGHKHWVLIPSRANDPDNFPANVQKLKDLSCHSWCTKTYNAEPYLSQGDFWILLDGEKTVAAVRLVGERVAEVQGEANNGAPPEEYTPDIQALIREKNIPAALWLVEHGQLTGEELAQYAEDPEDRVRLRIAERTDLPEDVLRKLATDKDWYVRREIAERTDLLEDVLRTLAEDPEEEVRREIAGRTDLPEDVLRKLAEDDPEKSVRGRIAERTDLLEDVLRTLAEDPEKRVRLRIAERTDLPEDVLRKLAEDPEEEVRDKIARTHALPEDVVGKLVTDKDWYVRGKIAERTDLLEDVLRTLAEDPEKRVRWRIAERTDLPEDVLRTLAKDEDWYVRRKIVDRTDLPENVVRTLATDEDWYVRREIAGRTDLPEDVLRTLAKDPEDRVRGRIAGRTDLPEDVLRTLAKDPEEKVREKIARTHALPEDVVGANPAPEAYYDPTADETVFNAAEIPDERRAEQLAFHEITHRNIYLLSKTPEGRRELSRIISGSKDHLIDGLPELLSLTGYTTLESLQRDYGFDSPEAVYFELLARQAEALQGREQPGWFRKVLSELRLWLNRHFGLSLDEESLIHWLSGRAMKPSRAPELRYALTDIRQVYAGPAAEIPLIARERLAAAQAMAAAGKNRQQIRALTGWFPGLGKDTKLRFEIADDQAAILETPSKKARPLGEILDHQDLYQVYPDAAEIMVRAEDLNGGAAFHSKLQAISVDTKARSARFKSLLLHEVQHWIQQREGFARGGSPAEFKRGLLAAIDSENQGSAYGRYRRLAGEIESRDVEARKRMSQEQRERTEPYTSENIALDEALVIFHGEAATMESIGADPESVSRLDYEPAEEPDQRTREFFDNLEKAWREDTGAKREAKANFTQLRLTDESGGTEALRRTVAVFERATGKRILWVDTDPRLPIPWRGAVDQARPNTIAIHARAPGSLLALIGHEWGHTLKAQDPRLFRQLQRSLAAYLDKDSVRNERRILAERYRRGVLSEEITNNIIGDFFTDPEFWAEVERQDAGLLRRLLDSIQSFFQQLADRVRQSEWGTEEMLTDVEAARRAVARAFNQALLNGPYSELPGITSDVELAPDSRAGQTGAPAENNLDIRPEFRYKDSDGNATAPDIPDSQALGAVLRAAYGIRSEESGRPDQGGSQVEADKLRQWARQHSRVLDPGAFENFLASREKLDSGTEHDVWLDGESKRVVKVTIAQQEADQFGHAGHASEYLRQLHLSNRVFGDRIALHGIVERADGSFAIVISQPAADPLVDENGRNVPLTELMVMDSLREAGFKVGVEAFHDDNNIQITDIGNHNWILTEDGLRPIDIHVTPIREGEPIVPLFEQDPGVVDQPGGQPIQRASSGRSATEGRVVRPEALAQRDDATAAKAFFTTMANGQSLLAGIEDQADVSSVIHEFGHFARLNLAEGHLEVLEAAYRVKDGTWTEESEERFARDLERYIRDGKLPPRAKRHTGLAEAFARLADIMGRIYREVRDTVLGNKLDPKVSKVLDEIFEAGAEAQAEAQAGSHPLTDPGPGNTTERLISPVEKESTPTSRTSTEETALERELSSELADADTAVDAYELQNQREQIATDLGLTEEADFAAIAGAESEFRAWWKQARNRPKKQGVIDGLKAQGITFLKKDGSERLHPLLSDIHAGVLSLIEQAEADIREATQPEVSDQAGRYGSTSTSKKEGLEADSIQPEGAEFRTNDSEDQPQIPGREVGGASLQTQDRPGQRDDRQDVGARPGRGVRGHNLRDDRGPTGRTDTPSAEAAAELDADDAFSVFVREFQKLDAKRAVRGLSVKVPEPLATDPAAALQAALNDNQGNHAKLVPLSEIAKRTGQTTEQVRQFFSLQPDLYRVTKNHKVAPRSRPRSTASNASMPVPVAPDLAQQTPITDDQRNTARLSFYRELHDEAVRAGLVEDPDHFDLLAPARQAEFASDLMQQRFGIDKVSYDPGAPIRNHLDNLFDAAVQFQNLAAILRLSERGVSLNGTLNLNTARRRGNQLGFYSRGDRTLNVVDRNSVVAHEWWHAVDFWLLESINQSTHSKAQKNRGASGARRRGRPFVQLPPAIEQAFRDLIHVHFFDQAELARRIMEAEVDRDIARSGSALKKAQDKLEALLSGAARANGFESDFFANARNLTATRGNYWARPTEMLARSFEQFMAQQASESGISTEFLAEEGLINPNPSIDSFYPRGAQRVMIHEAWHHFFGAVAPWLNQDKPVASITEGPRRGAESWLPRTAEESILRRLELTTVPEDVKARTNEVKREKARPKDPRGQLSKFSDLVPRSITGTLSRLEHKYRGPMPWRRPDNVTEANGREIADIVAEIRDRLVGRKGSGRETGEHVQRESERRTRATVNRIEAIYRDAGVNLKTEDDGFHAEVRRILTLPATDTPNSTEQRALQVAKGLRRLLNEIWEETNLTAGQNAAGDQEAQRLGYVTENYFPRVYDVGAAAADREGFRAAAMRLFALMRNRELGEARAQRDMSTPETREGIEAEIARIEVLLQPDALRAAADGWFDQLYYGEQLNMTAGAQAPGQPQANPFKHRALPAEADQIMAGFLQTDPISAISHYADALHRRNAWVKRMGLDNSWLRGKQEHLKALGMHPADLEVLLKNVFGAAGMTGHKKGNDGLNLLHAAVTLDLLQRASISALTEPLVIGFNTNVFTGVKATGRFLLAGLTELFQHGNVSEARRVFRYLGVLEAEGVNHILANRYSLDFADSPKLAAVSAKFFANSMLTPITRLQSRIAASLGYEMLTNFANDWSSASPRVRQEILRTIHDYGFQGDPESLFESLRGTNRPSLDMITRLPEEQREQLAAFLNTFRGTSIQDTVLSDRPLVAQNPYLKVLFGITGFASSFYENIYKASYRKIVTEAAAGRLDRSALSSLNFLSTAAILTITGAIVNTMRFAALGGKRAEEEKEELEERLGRKLAWSEFVLLASMPVDEKGNLQRDRLLAGYLRAMPPGLLQQPVDIYTGVNYRRDPATIMSGATLGTLSDRLAGIVLGLEGASRIARRTAGMELTNGASAFAAEERALEATKDTGDMILNYWLTKHSPGGLVGKLVGMGLAWEGSQAATGRFADWAMEKLWSEKVVPNTEEERWLTDDENRPATARDWQDAVQGSDLEAMWKLKARAEKEINRKQTIRREFHAGTLTKIPSWIASSAAQKKAKELGVDLRRVTGTAKSGAITVKDVEQAAGR